MDGATCTDPSTYRQADRQTDPLGIVITARNANAAESGSPKRTVSGTMGRGITQVIALLVKNLRASLAASSMQGRRLYIQAILASSADAGSVQHKSANTRVI